MRPRLRLRLFLFRTVVVGNTAGLCCVIVVWIDLVLVRWRWGLAVQRRRAHHGATPALLHVLSGHHSWGGVALGGLKLTDIVRGHVVQVVVRMRDQRGLLQ